MKTKTNIIQISWTVGPCASTLPFQRWKLITQIERPCYLRGLEAAEEDGSQRSYC